jgi:hypothetical protein
VQAGVRMTNLDHAAEAKRQLAEDAPYMEALASIARSLVELNEVMKHAVFPQKIPLSWHETPERDLGSDRDARLD